MVFLPAPPQGQAPMNMTATYAGSSQTRDTTSSFETKEQGDGQLLFVTTPAPRPTFVFDSAVIIGGSTFTILALDYFLFGAQLYMAAMVLTIIGAGLTWICLKILHRERRKDVRSCRFYVSNNTINIPPAQGNGKMTSLLASNIDRLVIRATVAHTETINTAFGKVGTRGMEAKDRRNGWFADHSFNLEAESAGRVHVLATGLDEVTANGLMMAVSRKLGF
jgi:hypothetical protein